MSLPIALEHVTHAYRTAAGPLPVLNDLSIDMPEGSFTAVVGPSGCGKSTLTRLIAGLMKPDQGVVRLGGEKVTGPRRAWVTSRSCPCPERRRTRPRLVRAA